MKSEHSDIAAVILAAGKGVRMQSDMPKVLHPFCGKPLISHVIDTVRKVGIDNIIVVIGYKGEEVANTLDDVVQFVWQKEQKGTGHAVLQAEPVLQNFNGKVLVLCGDVPLISRETIVKMCREARRPRVKALVLTMLPENSAGYGRIKRDEKSCFAGIVEEKDAGKEEKAIKEVNTGTYVFDKDLLFFGLKNITDNNAQGEYYLPDVLSQIKSKGWEVNMLRLENALEGSGINSPEELLRLEKIVCGKKK